MSLTVADIERWNSEAVREVFNLAGQRAQATHDVSRGLGALSLFDSWAGAASLAARNAIAMTRQDLDAHGTEVAAVAMAAAKAADEIDRVKADLQRVKNAAESHGLEIDPVAGAVEAMPHAPHGRREQQEWLPRIAAMLAAVIAAADQADVELASAINMADGDAAIPPTPAGTVPAPPPRGTDPIGVTRWWNSLTPAQQAAEKAVHPAEVGTLNGIPAKVREEVNAARLPGEIAKAQATVAAQPRLPKPNPAQLDAQQAARNKLADLLALRKTLTTHPEVGLLLLDTTSNQENVLAAIAKGDVDNAERVGVTVGGMTTNVRSSVDGMTREAIAQHDEAVRLRRNSATSLHPDAVASIAWLGYEAPGMNLDVGSDAMAKTGAAALNNFYKGLDATTNVADQHIVAFGHSYGSLTTSLALQQGAPVDDVVLYGSPGAEVSNAGQLGVAPGHAFFIDGVTDGVPATIAKINRFGPPLGEVPGFTELSAYSGQAPGGTLGDNQWHERAYGHSEYARSGDNGQLRMSGYNLAAVLAGLPQDTIAPPTNPPEPFIVGGRALVPNPNYHP